MLRVIWEGFEHLRGSAETKEAPERHRVDLATKAAARYLKDLYSTDAQASGLLVMASYNWGENQVLPLIRSMPANPKDRNFWQLLTKHRDRIPQETYDYVFFIVSAAVIGENPRLFGFDFDNPLGHLEQSASSQEERNLNGIVPGIAGQNRRVYSGSRGDVALAQRDSAVTREYGEEAVVRSSR